VKVGPSVSLSDSRKNESLKENLIDITKTFPQKVHTQNKLIK
jgi:hypothetical protein